MKDPPPVNVIEQREKTLGKMKLFHEFNQHKKEQANRRKQYLSDVLASPLFEDAVRDMRGILTVRSFSSRMCLKAIEG